jgi:hypothetical protein
MAESVAKTLQVKLIRGGEPSPATVQDPSEVPWTVIDDPSQAEVRWSVIVFPPESEPLVFETVEEVTKWVERDDRASGMNWTFLTRAPGRPDSTEEDKEATRRYIEFAARPENEGLSQAEVFRRAHEQKIVRSLALYERFGCTGRCHIVQRYLSDWAVLGYNWWPRSCLIYGQGALFSSANRCGEKSQVSGSYVCIDLAFLAEAAEVL